MEETTFGAVDDRAEDLQRDFGIQFDVMMFCFRVCNAQLYVYFHKQSQFAPLQYCGDPY